jgi:hypothetical protein
MYSDYIDNWDALPERVQIVLEPVIAQFDAAADLLFDRRLNLSFEAAVKGLSIPGIAALTEGLRGFKEVLAHHVTVTETVAGQLLFDRTVPLTPYDLPFYTPCIYLSQVTQAMERENVRVWKESTVIEMLGILLLMASYVPPKIATAQVVVAALHDLVFLYPTVIGLLETEQPNANAALAAETALSLVRKRIH